jgi:cell division protein FtsB|tara:strand:- start:940 stop:1248 length:309 start_codon:yes stop_codon:yes gene_type:complete
MQMSYFFNFIILLSVIFLVINSFSIFIGDDGRKLNNELKSELSAYKNERDLIFDMNETLEEEIISIQMSDSFVESYAREKLDLVKPDEVLIEIDVTKDNPNE